MGTGAATGDSQNKTVAGDILQGNFEGICGGVELSGESSKPGAPKLHAMCR